VHFNSVGASTRWGPVWATREKLGLDARDEGDVELAQKGIKPLEEFSRQTKTTVHRFVTHEPMFRARTFVNDGVIPVESDDKKQWSRLSRTPGTPEFRNNLNRLSDNEAIRNAQFQADAQQWLKSKMGTSTDVAQARSLLTDFGLKYNEIYGIAGKQNLPFDLKDSISEKIQNFNVKNIADNVTSKLTSQVIDNFSNATNDLFKDNVFVNSAGELFTLANSRIKGVSDELSAINREVNSVKGLVNNISTKNVVGTVANLNSITQTYSQVVGGKVVNTAVQNFAAKGIKNFATKSGLFNAREAAIGGQSFLQNVGANLGSKIATGIKSVGSFFSGFKFSDRRLKEDIRLIGKSPSGVNIYSFKYYQIPGRYIGVMAQEVPWARHMTDYGYYAVDYNKVDVEFRRLN